MEKFTKEDLRNRMVVVLRDGTTCLYVDDYFISINGWISINNYDDNLCRSPLKERDVIAVYSEIWTLEDIEGINKRTPLWKYSGAIEVTMEEVSRRFGCEVKIIPSRRG